MAKKTTSVIDIGAMGKAGQMTGLNTGKQESGVPTAIKSIGKFALNQYFRASESQKLARVNAKKLFSPISLKALKLSRIKGFAFPSS